MARPKKEVAASPPATKKKGVKKPKDPNAPKRALSAYFIWLKENRSKFTKKGDAASVVARAAGEAWKKLDDKSEWEAKAAEDKKRYAKEMTAYKKKKEGGAEEDEDDEE